MSTPPGSTESIPAWGVGKTGNHGGVFRWGIKRAASKLQAYWNLGPALSRLALRAPLRAGHLSGSDEFLTHPARDLRFAEAAKPMADYHLDLLRVLGVETGAHPPSVVIRPEDGEFAGALTGRPYNCASVKARQKNRHEGW